MNDGAYGRDVFGREFLPRCEGWTLGLAKLSLQDAERSNKSVDPDYTLVAVPGPGSQYLIKAMELWSNEATQEPPAIVYGLISLIVFHVGGSRIPHNL